MKSIQRRVALASLAAIAGLGALGAQAATSYSLRNFSFESTTAQNQSIDFVDNFNNQSPLTGAIKKIGGLPSAADYSVFNNGFSAGVETTPNDWAATQFGVGRLELRASDARDSGPNNLNAPGMSSISNRLTVADVAGTPLLSRTSTFEVRAYYDFVAPEAGSYYGLRLSDNFGGNYNDLYDLRLSSGNNSPTLNLRRLTSTGGILTSQNLGSYNLASQLPIGKTLADIGLIGFEFHYNYFGEGNVGNGMQATFEALDTTGADLLRLTVRNSDGSPRIFSLFNGEDFTRAAVGANWTAAAPVPEPASMALLAMGLAVVGVARRRRQAKLA